MATRKPRTFSPTPSECLLHLQAPTSPKRQQVLDYLRFRPQKIVSLLEPLLQLLWNPELSVSRRLALLDLLSSIRSKLWKEMEPELFSWLLAQPHAVVRLKTLQLATSLKLQHVEFLRIVHDVQNDSSTQVREGWYLLLNRLPLSNQIRWEWLWETLQKEQSTSLQQTALQVCLELLQNEQSTQTEPTSRAWLTSETLLQLSNFVDSNTGNVPLLGSILQQWQTLQPGILAEVRQQTVDATQFGELLWELDAACETWNETKQSRLLQTWPGLPWQLQYVWLQGLQVRFAQPENEASLSIWAAFLPELARLPHSSLVASQFQKTLSALPESHQSLFFLHWKTTIGSARHEEKKRLQQCLSAFVASSEHSRSFGEEPLTDSEEFLALWALQDRVVLKQWLQQWQLEPSSARRLLHLETLQMTATKALRRGNLRTHEQLQGILPEILPFWSTLQRQCPRNHPDWTLALESLSAVLLAYWWPLQQQLWKQAVTTKEKKPLRFWWDTGKDAARQSFQEACFSMETPPTLLHLQAHKWARTAFEEFRSGFEWQVNEVFEERWHHNNEELESFAYLTPNYSPQSLEQSIQWIFRALQLKREWIAGQQTNKALRVMWEQFSVVTERASNFDEPWELPHMITESLQPSPMKAAWDTAVAIADLYLLDTGTHIDTDPIPVEYLESWSLLRHWRGLLEARAALKYKALPQQPPMEEVRA